MIADTQTMLFILFPSFSLRTQLPLAPNDTSAIGFTLAGLTLDPAC
jgi:hypothetical protein